MITFRANREAHTLQLDPDHLPVRDRACLRLLARADAATASQLATLVYRRRRTAQERLHHLWRGGLLERSPAPQDGPGTSPYAYRLSSSARTRLGVSGRRAAGPIRLRHTLDGVAVACALVADARDTGRIMVSAWLPEPMLRSLDLGPGVVPDGLMVLDSAAGSGVLCIEIDEGTQHAAIIRPRLAAYARALQDRPGWALLMVVPSESRAAWLRRLAAHLDNRSVTPIGWVATITALEQEGAAGRVHALGSDDRTLLMKALVDTRSRATPTPIGSAAWVTLLGEGGGEDLTDTLA